MYGTQEVSCRTQSELAGKKLKRRKHLSEILAKISSAYTLCRLKGPLYLSSLTITATVKVGITWLLTHLSVLFYWLLQDFCQRCHWIINGKHI